MLPETLPKNRSFCVDRNQDLCISKRMNQQCYNILHSYCSKKSADPVLLRLQKPQCLVMKSVKRFAACDKQDAYFAREMSQLRQVRPLPTGQHRVLKLNSRFFSNSRFPATEILLSECLFHKVLLMMNSFRLITQERMNHRQ